MNLRDLFLGVDEAPIPAPAGQKFVVSKTTLVADRQEPCFMLALYNAADKVDEWGRVNGEFGTQSLLRPDVIFTEREGASVSKMNRLKRRLLARIADEARADAREIGILGEV